MSMRNDYKEIIMFKKLVSGFLIIASLMSMSVTSVTASGLTSANISHGMFDLKAGEEGTTLYSYKYTKSNIIKFPYCHYNHLF